MAIPTAADHKLAEVEQMADGIKTRLIVMRHAGKGTRDMVGLRDALQAYVDATMAFARGTQR